MAIAFDIATNVTSTGSSTTHTYAHTCTGSDRILFASIATLNDAGNDTVTGVTYNGVAMTRINTARTTGFAWRGYLYYLIAPATGSNNIVATKTGTTGQMYGSSASYTGALQSGVPDASNTADTSGSPATVSVTTVADNCWAVLTGGNVDAEFAASTNSTKRNTGNPATLFDSNANISPAGSFSMTLTYAGTRQYELLMASFAPSVAVTFIPKVMII